MCANASTISDAVLRVRSSAPLHLVKSLVPALAIRASADWSRSDPSPNIPIDDHAPP